MPSFTEILHVFTVSWIRGYKSVELQFLRLISPWLSRKGCHILQSIGIIFHDPDEPELTPEQEKEIAAKSQYSSLLHVDLTSKTEYFSRAANRGNLGLGETFMEGVWRCRGGDDQIVELTRRILEKGLLNLYFHPWNRWLEHLELCAFNLQTKTRAFQVGKEHYDLGNDLYELMLDSRMQYTCGYWKTAKNLEEAQLHKMELIAQKLQLKPGMRVLDIGCGFGSLSKHLAKHYGVEMVGVSISKEQVAYGKEICKGLPVDIRLQDYRDVDEKFDRIVSIGCLEHVGFKNYREFFKLAKKCLKPDGLFLCHCIGNADDFPRSEHWLNTYIFPNANLPYANDITKAVQGQFVIEDWHNFGLDYAHTLKAWRENFNTNWHKIQHKYGENFRRMWIYYLTISEGIFRARKCQLWQVVLSPQGLKEGYRAPR